MAGIDPSIPLNANRPQPVNPLTQIQQYAQTGNAQLQMAQARMQLMSRNALMQAYQNAPLDPATGLPDTRAVLNYLQQNNGGLAMPDAVKDAQIQGLQGYATRQADLSQSLNRNSAIAQFMAPVLALGDNATPGDVYDAFSRAHDAGVPTDGAMASLQTQLPITDPDQFGNPAYRKQLGRDTHAFAQSLVLQGQAPNVGLDAATPKPAQINRGSSIIAPDMSPITNHGATSLNVPLTLSPEAQNTRIPTFQGGKPGTVPLASVAAPGTMPGSQGGAPSPLGTGRYPTAATNAAPAGEAPVGTPLPPPAGGGFVQSGAAPGQAEAAAAQGHAYGDMAGDLVRSAASVSQQKALLGNMEANLDNFSSGPGAQEWRNAIAAYNRIMPASMAINQSGVASQEEYAKMGYQVAQTQFNTLGGTGTDAKFSSTMHTSPSEFLSNLGNHGIIALLKGNADAIGVMGGEWQKWLAAHNQDVNTYGQFVSQFNQQYDPRVFQSQYVKDPREMLKGMTPAEQQKFRQDYNTAVANHWIPDPRGGQNAAQ